jgi:hypothetical protein
MGIKDMLIDAAKDKLIDKAQDKLIDTAEDRLLGKAKEEKTSFGSATLRFVISLIWFVITFVATLIAFICMFAGSMMETFTGDGNSFGILAIALCFIIFIVTFIVPYLRKKGSFTRWCGIVALGDAIWWIYIMIAG